MTNAKRKRRHVEETDNFETPQQLEDEIKILRVNEMHNNRGEEIYGDWKIADNLEWDKEESGNKIKNKEDDREYFEKNSEAQEDNIQQRIIDKEHSIDPFSSSNEHATSNIQFRDATTMGENLQSMSFPIEYDAGREDILRRSRRALKLKIKRKTSLSSTEVSHPDEISIDEQYLLPNGLIKPDKKHWLYNDMSTLRGFPYYGYFATYSGGGYVASLSTDIDFARATAMALEQDSWADMLTRALLFEFSVYNANMNFFATGFVIIEIHPTGSVVPNANIRVFKLYRYVGTFGKVVMASEIILVLCLFFFIYKECRHMYRLGCGYFKLFWSWIEITIAVALFTALILRAFSWYEGDKNLIALRQNMEQFINFHYTVVADDALLTSVMIICFLSTLKVIKIIEIFPTIVSLKDTLRRCMKPLLNYAFPFTVAFCAFAMMSHLLFRETGFFMTYIKTAETQLLMLIGGSVFEILQGAHSILGPLFFFLFSTFETFILMNVFLSIINDGISQSANWGSEAKANKFYEFMEERASLMLRAFSDSLQKTASKVPFGFQKVENVVEASEGGTEDANSVTNSKKTKNVDEEPATACELIINRLENKLSESFLVDSHDMKDFLTLLTKLKRKKTTIEKMNGWLK